MRDHIGAHRQADGRYYVGFAPVVGRVSGTLLAQVADLAAAYGSDRVRTTVEQKLLILDVPAERVEDLVADLDALGLQVRPSPFRRQTMACTGIEFCKLAIVETKARGRGPDRRDGTPDARVRPAPDDQRQRLPERVRALPGRGHRAQGHADDRRRRRGPSTGYQIHLGGSLGQDAGFGRKLRGLKVASADLEDYVERVLRRFLAQREPAERFASWVLRAGESDLL